MDPTQNKIVLLVECEGYWIAVLRQMLREKGFGVFWAHNGLEAITLCTRLQLHPDLLISSIHLPKMNGIDLAQWFRLRQPSIRILLLAEYSDLLPSDPDCYGKELKIVRRPGTKEIFWETIQELVPWSVPSWSNIGNDELHRRSPWVFHHGALNCPGDDSFGK